MKTNDLTGPALDWAVAKCEGIPTGPLVTKGRIFYLHKFSGEVMAHARNWAQGGPIVEREKITLEWTGEDWMAYIRHDEEFFGPTPLIAAMRCYVASKLGDDIVIPEFLRGV